MTGITERVSTKLFRYLQAEGVTHVFGIPGGALAHLMNDFYERPDEMTYVITRHETGAAYMADGYFRATGRLGVVAVTSGPGATNALTGAVNSQSAYSRTLILTGEVQEEFYGRGYLQEGTEGSLDVNSVYSNAVAYSAVISAPGNSKTLIEAALRYAGTIPYHTTHLSLPLDIGGGMVDYEVPETPMAYTPRPSAPSRDSLVDVLKIFAKSKRPMIFLGNGCRFPLRDPARLAKLRAFAHDWGIPVVTTADGKGIFPETDPMSLGAFGIANAMWPYYWMSQKEPSYDAFLIVASGMSQLATNVWNPMLVPDGPIIQVDANPNIIARAFPTELGIEGDSGLFFDGLMEIEAEYRPDPAIVAERRKMMAEIRSTKERFDDPAAYNSQSAPVHPAALCRAMQEALAPGPQDDGTLIFGDAGNCVGWGIHYLVADTDFEVHHSLDMGPMGFAVCAVVGAKIGRPDAICVAFTGDAAFMMQGAEISTAAQNKVGAIWVVLDDNDLSMVSQGMQHFYGGDLNRWKELYALGAPDLAAFAKGLGADAYVVDTYASAKAALEQAVIGSREGRPQVVVAKIDPNAEPPYYNPLYSSESKGGL